jgi:hypothetical protein
MDQPQPWEGRVVRSKTTGVRVRVQSDPVFGIFAGVCIGNKAVPVLPANMQYYWDYWMANNFHLEQDDKA